MDLNSTLRRTSTLIIFKLMKVFAGMSSLLTINTLNQRNSRLFFQSTRASTLTTSLNQSLTNASAVPSMWSSSWTLISKHLSKSSRKALLKSQWFSFIHHLSICPGTLENSKIHSRTIKKYLTFTTLIMRKKLLKCSIPKNFRKYSHMLLL